MQGSANRSLLIAGTHATLPQMNKPSPLPKVLIVVTLLLLAFALRLHNLGEKDIWWDEAHSWYHATLPLWDNLSAGWTALLNPNLENRFYAATASGDPLYMLLLTPWISLIGETPFALRFLSLLGTWLAVPLLVRVTRRIVGPNTLVLALLLGAVAPMWVFYAQEVRQYFLMPAAMLFLIDAALDVNDPERSGRAGSWLKLAAAEAIALSTHGFMVFGVLLVNLWIGWVWLRGSRDLRWLRSAALGKLATLIFSLPTLPNYLLRGQIEPDQLAQRLPLPDLLQAQWTFWMGVPWVHVRDPLPAVWVAAAILPSALLLMIPAFWRRSERALYDMLWIVLGTTGIVLIYWQINPIIHPRYIFYLSPLLLIVFTGLILRAWDGANWERAGSGLLCGLLFISAGLNIDSLYNNRGIGWRHDQTVGLAEFLRDEYDTDDGLISIDGFDRTLDYYDIGSAPLFRADFDRGLSAPASLLPFLVGKDHIGVVVFHAQRSDTRQIVPFYLERYGAFESRQTFEGYAVDRYQLDPASEPQPVRYQPIDLRWPGLRASGYSLQSGDAITLAIRWKAEDALSESRDLAARVTLREPSTDWFLGEDRRLLFSSSGQPTSLWSPGEQTESFYVIPLYPGTPPLDAEVSLRLFDSQSGQPIELIDDAGAPAGQVAQIATVTTGQTLDTWRYGAPPFALTPHHLPWLAGLALDWPSVPPGAAIRLTLDMPAEHDLSDLVLMQNGQVIHDELQIIGDQAIVRLQLRVRPDAENGPAEIRLGEDVLATVEISGVPRLFDPPPVETALDLQFGNVARLIGYDLDLPDPLTSEATIDLTLLWQAVADGQAGADYVCSPIWSRLTGA
ncbi:MAG: hypothetical protein GYB68_12375 [Chloroflexi bacterium]|nr:hypothetical protein [Chloroflexota bacterium]